MTTATITPFVKLRADIHAQLNAAYPELIDRMGWSRDRLLAHQRTRLEGLLRHAMERSPFHARRLAGLDPAAVDPADLRELPEMTKADMIAELDDVLTDRRLTRAEVEAALAATGDEPAVMHERFYAYTTGGSSGVRGVFVLDPAAAVSFIGSITRGLVARLQAMGGPPPRGLSVAMVGAPSAVHPTGSAESLCVGGGLPFIFHTVPATDPLPAIVAALNELRPAALFGYPTVLARLAEEQRAGRLPIRPAFATSSSETLTPELRARIRELGAPIVNTYATTEGLVGSSMPDDEVVVLAEDACIVEVEEDRVLVTNLENRTQPLIRSELVRTPEVLD